MARAPAEGQPWTDGRRPQPVAQSADRTGAGLAGVLEQQRDRWFLWLPVLMAAGALIYFALPVEPALPAAVAPLLLGLALRLVPVPGTLSMVALSAFTAVAAGLAAGKVRTLLVEGPSLKRTLRAAQVAGFVELVEPRPARGPRLTLRVSSIEGLEPAATPHRVRVRLMTPADGLKPGDPVRLTATLSPPSGPMLPGDYDFARAAFFMALGGVGYASRPLQAAPELGDPPLSLRLAARIGQLRQTIGERVRAALGGETGAIANALITGERGGISQATNDAYRDSGLYHMLSISGLHMAIIAGAVFFAVRLALALVPALALRHPTRKWAALAAAAAALAYLLISGGAFATVRAYVMITVMFLAVLLDRPALALRNVALSALAILLVFPESVHDVGFQMSFAAVTALVASYEAIRERMRSSGAEHRRGGTVRRTALFFGGIVLSTLIASAAVAPFAAYHFHKSQQFAVIANLIAIPICNFIVMPAALLTLIAMPLGAEWGPLWVMGQGIEMMGWCARSVAALPGAVARLPAIPPAAFLLAVSGGLWLALWRHRLRLVGLAMIAAALGIAPLQPRPDILIGHDGGLVAVRGAGQTLSVLAPRGSGHQLQRWLEHEGDGRPLHLASSADGYRCDARGCTAEVGGLRLAVSQRPAAVAEDCRLSDIIVMPFPRPAACHGEGERLVVDLYAVRDQGTHAIYLDGGKPRVVTVAGSRGVRPWSPDRAGRLEAARERRRSQTRLSGFSPPFPLGEGEGLDAEPFDDPAERASGGEDGEE